MRLSDWLELKDITRAEFARRIGVSPAHVTGLCKGETWPSRRVVREIERETASAVTAADFVNPPQPSPATPQSSEERQS
jgi:3,4-dihydroxy 2-butanone 4-phosphate synthase/GTP cyclohydrolase II